VLDTGESSIISKFWIPACAGMTVLMVISYIATQSLTAACVPFDNSPGRIAEVCPMRVFMIPGKVMHDGLAINQELEGTPVDGKVLILGHHAYLQPWVS
jgi:hypothetical protein